MKKTTPLLIPLLLSTAHARPPANLEETKQCVFYVQSFKKDGKPHASGSAFLVEDGSSQWIYTNAHVIDGGTKIEFTDLNGKPVSGFGRFACYSTQTGNGSIEVTENGKKRVQKFGCDGVRLELKSKMPIAFQLADRDHPIPIGTQIVTIGDNKGKKSMDYLEGKVTVKGSMTFLSDCKTVGGSSGGAVIEKSSLKVIGLNTWGFRGGKEDQEKVIWNGKAVIRGEHAGASMCHQATWIDVKPADFLKGAEHADRFRDLVRVMGLIYVSTPTHDGFRINYEKRLVDGVSVQSMFTKYANDIILRPVIMLNKRLDASERSVAKVNNMEICATYAKALRDVRDGFERAKKELNTNAAPYYRISLENEGYFALGEFCNQSFLPPQQWFREKSTAGGKLPLGRWFELPDWK